MIKNGIKNLNLLIFSIIIVSCNQQNKIEEKDNNSDEIINNVLTEEEQNALTADKVIALLKNGNERFINNDLTKRDHSIQVRKSTYAQYPKAIILSCIDSRVPVEDVFDRGIGDIFVARVAGNIVNEDILGSMEYACKVAGSKLILVMGHEHCGAVKAAVEDVKLGNVTAMLSKIKPAIDKVIYNGERTSKNHKFMELVCKSNVNNTIDEIRANSPILKELEDNNTIKIVGSVYDMDTGIVHFN